MNKNDLRYIKTEQIIFDAFKLFVKENGFEKVSVAQICEKAQISRNTFYQHYEDKYDLLESLFQQLEKNMKDSFSKELVDDLKRRDIHDSIVWMFDEVEKNKEMIVFLTMCSEKRMTDLYKVVLMDVPLIDVFSNYDYITSQKETILIKNYIFHATVGFLQTWIQQEDRINKQDAIGLLERIITEPVNNYFLSLEKYQEYTKTIKKKGNMVK